MRKINVLLTAAIMATFALAAARAEAKVTVERSKLKGPSFYAEWLYQEGDIATFVALVVSSETELAGPGRPEPMPLASLNILRGNVVTGEVLLAGAAYTTDFTLAMDRDLDMAHFATTAVFQDDSTFTFFDIAMDVDLTATAELVRQKCNEHYRDANLHLIVHMDNVHRDAEASGSIFGRDTEFIPMPSTGAHMHVNSNGNMMITIEKHAD